MSRTLFACFLFFLSPCPLFTALVCLLASACSPARRAWDERADCRFAAAGMETVCLLVPMPSLSRLSARSLFPAQSSSGLPAVVFLLPPHRMSNELVKTARADRSSVKPLQFIPVSSPPRIGCRTMCPTGCLPAASRLSRFACLPLSHPFRSSVSSLAPSCVSCLCSPIRLLISSCVPHLVLRALSCLSGWHVRLVSYAHPACSRLARSPRRSAYPLRLSCRRAGRPASRSHLVMRPAYRLCVSLVLFSACLPLY